MGKKLHLPVKEDRAEEIALCTTTFYKNWSSSFVRKGNTADTVRGDLAINSIIHGLWKGYHVVVVDGGSSTAFLDVLSTLKPTNRLHVHNQVEPGIGPRNNFE